MILAMPETAATQIVHYEPAATVFRALMSSQRPKREWADVDSELRSLLDLDHNWDEAGAMPPSEEVVFRVIDFMAFSRQLGVCAPDVVRATPDGGVSIEWHREPQVTELEFGEIGMSAIEYDVSTGESRVVEIATR